MQINYLALVLTTILIIAVSALYYLLLNKRVVAIRMEAKNKNTDVRTTLTPNKLIIEFVRTFILGLVLAYACVKLNINGLNQAVVLGFWLWVGFPAVLLTGSVIHEHFPPKLAAIHAGDWLVKILLFTTILSIWH